MPDIETSLLLGAIIELIFFAQSEARTIQNHIMAHLTLDRSNYQIQTNGKTIKLEPGEFNILWLLAEKPEKIFQGKELFGELRKTDPMLTEHPFRNYMLQLFFKLNQRYIQMLDGDKFRLHF